MLKDILSLLRLHQWIKNAFIFIPLFFGQKFFDMQGAWLPSLVAFVAYGLAASAIYCFNDIYDADLDRLHKTKRHRPVASGAISPRKAYALMGGCIFASFSVLWGGFLLSFMGEEVKIVSYLIFFYLVMNIAYCIRIKHIAVIDVFIIAVGFVLRLIVGGVASQVQLSHWIILMTFLLALFLAFAKRRDDAITYEETGVKARPNVNRYSVDFLTQCITIVATMSMICYIMYTLSEEVMIRLNTAHLYITSVFVLLGFIRYLQLTMVDASSGSPTKILLKDRFLQLTILGWVFAFATILYF